MDLRIMPAMEILGMKFLRGFEIPRNLQIFPLYVIRYVQLFHFGYEFIQNTACMQDFTHISLFCCLCIHTLVLLITTVVVIM